MLSTQLLALLSLVVLGSSAANQQNQFIHNFQPTALPPSLLTDPPGSTNDELYLSFAELVVPHGYPLEQHFVTTRDGYVLRLFRIPHGRAEREAASRPPRGKAPEEQAAGKRSGRPVATRKLQDAHAASTGAQQPQGRPVAYLQHGLLDSAAAFVLNGPAISLAFLLADSGYDVWMGNVRGNSFSRAHTSLPTSSPAFWAFSWDHFVAIDLPALLAHTLRTSGAPSLVYAAHSQGTTMALAALSTVPEVRAAIRAAALLAPVAMVQHITSIPLLAMALWQTDSLFEHLGILEFLPNWRQVAALEGSMCAAEPALCANILTAIGGYNPSNLNMTRLPLYLAFTPAGTSVQNMAHWSQMVRAKRPWELRAFDYGTACSAPSSGRKLPCNQREYGSPEPPLYNLSAITTPLAIYAGEQDRLADPMDLEFLVEALPGGVIRELHMEASYEHLDFTWGVNARTRIYHRVLAFFRSFPPEA